MMIFGWMLSATPGGQHLAQAAGHCQGRESFLISQATRILSATVFCDNDPAIRKQRYHINKNVLH